MKIDLDKILKDKAPKLSPFIAKPLAMYLKRIVHQKEINDFLSRAKDLPAIEFLAAVLDNLEITYKTHNFDSLDPTKRYMFASNHPFGGLDGMALMKVVSQKFSDVGVISNDILMNLKPLTPLFIPVNKHGKQTKECLNHFKEMINCDKPLITFPAGMCSRKINGKIVDLGWKHSFVKHSIESERDIVPVFFDGQLSKFFYRLHSLRTKLGIKANLEMLYLADEMFKQRGQTLNIYFGEPISYKQLKSEGTPRSWTEKIREISYSLKK